MNPIQGLRPAFDASVFLQNAQAMEAGPANGVGTGELPGVADVRGAGVVERGGFESMLGKLVNEVSAKQADSAETVRSMLGGEAIPLHQAMIAMEEASISFQLMVEVRNKLLESYQELMRMQI